MSGAGACVASARKTLCSVLGSDWPDTPIDLLADLVATHVLDLRHELFEERMAVRFLVKQLLNLRAEECDGLTIGYLLFAGGSHLPAIARAFDSAFCSPLSHASDESERRAIDALAAAYESDRDPGDEAGA